MTQLLCTAATDSFTAGIMEHPAIATWQPDAPSSWFLAELRWLRSHVRGDSLDIDQCMYDAPSRKPTTLLSINCSALRDVTATSPNSGRCSGDHVHAQVLVGKAEDGLSAQHPPKNIQVL